MHCHFCRSPASAWTESGEPVCKPCHSQLETRAAEREVIKSEPKERAVKVARATLLATLKVLFLHW